MARMYYALQSVQFNGPSNGSQIFYGVQSIGASSQSDRTPVFQLGQLGTYSSYSTDDSPVEITISKQLDGQALLYETLLGNNSVGFREGEPDCSIQFNFWDNPGEASGSAAASPISSLYMPEYTISSVTYTFEADGVATEEVTLIGDALSTTTTAAIYLSYESGCAPDLATRAAIKEVDGGSPLGYQSISFTYTKNIESLYSLGKFKNVERYVSYPTECTIDITKDVLSIGQLGDSTSETAGSCTGATGSCGGGDFSVELCDGTIIRAGNTVVTSQSYQGGDTGGGQLQYVESLSSWDDFTVEGPTNARL